ncbi:MAG: FIVAR domain-containing protein, partial [Clostridia bacterium]|nr:FIVAR domain-containing protein [Clostridia bacterium]
MKKNLKKVLSVILTLMMVFSCFSGIGHIEAKALPATDSTYATGDKYGTVKWSGTGDRWFCWSTGSDYVKVYYPSHIYLDISETLQSAGYHFDVEWHFGDSSKYRILLGAPVWGDHSAFSGMPTKYYTMTNIFSDYAVDASLPKGAPAGWYNDGTGSATDYDLRIVGYNYSDQGTDGFTQNGARHEKYVLWRTNTSYYNPASGSIYLKGTPSSSYVGKTTEYNTSGGSIGSYGLAQQYESGSKWSTASSASMFNTKGSDSSYMEGQWIEMQWYVTVYDKSTLNSEILKASQVISQQNGYDAYIVSGSMSDLKQHNSEAQTTITVREQTQTDIENQRTALQNAAAALYYGASNAELRQLVSEAESYIGSAEYSAKYSESSRTDLESALANAKALSYYSSVPTYQAYNNSSAGANAARDQATIDSVANELKTAIEKLKTSVSVYTYTFNKADGTSKTLTYAYGYTIPASAIPANTVKEADILNHYTYTWDKEIEYTVTGNVVFNEVLVTEAHDWSDWVTTVYPSCSAEGNEYRECNICTYRQDIPIQKTAHTPMEPVITDEVPATCTAEGSYLSTVYCSECSEVVSSQTVKVAKLAHTPGEKVIENNIPFTCTEDGSYDEVYYCTECGTEISRKNILVGAAHIDGEPIVEVQEPTCLVAGVTRTTVLCAVCGQLLRETVVPGEIGEHIPGEAVKENIVDAGCTEGGSYDMVTRCTVCQFIISSEHFTTQAGEHDWGDWEIVTPVTCTENGLEQRVCKNDPSHKEENIIRSNGHTAGETKEVEKVEPSCIDPGYVVTVTYCSVCGGEVERTRTNIAAVGHSFGDWYVNVEASCTKEGEEMRDCNNCNHSETKVIEMKDHDYESVVTLPTCTKDGYTTYDCKNCDASYIDDETGMLGHKNADPVIENEVEAECEKEGSYDTVVYCSVCNEELSRVKTTVPAKDHTEAAAVIENEVEAECEKEGSYDTVVYCSVCNKELSRVKTTVPATDHDWDEWQTVTPATCGADGLEKRVCKNNSAHYEENVIKATGEHVYATEVDRKDATCTEDGYVIMACGCGATEKTDILSEGHKEAE